jgi:hypothetical protein
LLIFVVGLCWLLVTRLEVKKNLISSVNHNKKNSSDWQWRSFVDALDSAQYS